MKIVDQDGSPYPVESLISSVKLRVEVRGTEVGDTLRLLAMRKLDDLPTKTAIERSSFWGPFQNWR